MDLQGRHEPAIPTTVESAVIADVELIEDMELLACACIVDTVGSEPSVGIESMVDIELK